MRLFIICLLLASMPVLAGEDLLISEETHEHGTNVSFGGSSHKLLVLSGEEILLDSANATREIELDECISAHTEKLCYTGSQDNTSAELSRYTRKAILEASHDINTTPLFVGEEREQRLILNNTGNIPAEDVGLLLNIPSHMQVVESMYCDTHVDSIAWQTTIDAEEAEVCRYTVRSLREGDFRINGTMTYRSVDSTVEDTIGDYTLTARFPFSLSINTSSPFRGAPFNVTVRVTSNSSENVTLEEFTFTDGGNALYEGGPLEDVRVYSHRTLRPNTTSARTFEFVNHGRKPYEMSLAMDYRMDNSYEFTYPIDIHPRQGALEFNVSAGGEVTQLEELTVNIDKHVVNPYLNYSSPLVLVDGMRGVEENFSLDTKDTFHFTVPADHPAGEHELRVRIRYTDSLSGSHNLTRLIPIEVEALKTPRIQKELAYNESAGKAYLTLRLTNRLPFNTTFSIEESNPFHDAQEDVRIATGQSEQVLRLPIGRQEIEDAPSVAVSNTTVRYSVGPTQLNHSASSPLHFSDITQRWEETNTTNQTTQQPPVELDSYPLPFIAGIVALLILVLGGLMIFRRKRRTKTTSQEETTEAPQQVEGSSEPAKEQEEKESQGGTQTPAGDDQRRMYLINRAQELEGQLNRELEYVEDPRETDKAMEIEKEYRRVLDELRSLEGEKETSQDEEERT